MNLYFQKNTENYMVIENKDAFILDKDLNIVDYIDKYFEPRNEFIETEKNLIENLEEGQLESQFESQEENQEESQEENQEENHSKVISSRQKSHGVQPKLIKGTVSFSPNRTGYRRDKNRYLGDNDYNLGNLISTRSHSRPVSAKSDKTDKLH